MSESKEKQGERSGVGHEATVISVILDRSGSMGHLRESTIAGFNDFVRDQRKETEGGRALMSLTQFDDRYEVNFVGEPLENVPDLDAQSYVPRGSTALNDAIGRTVHELEAWTKAHDWTERVLVLIITDGLENASKEYSLAAIRALIERKENDGWNFVYLGANQDAYQEGEARSVRASYSRNFDASPAGVSAMYLDASVAARGYRKSVLKGRAAPAFFEDAPGEKKPEPVGKLVPKGGK